MHAEQVEAPAEPPPFLMHRVPLIGAARPQLGLSALPLCPWSATELFEKTSANFSVAYAAHWPGQRPTGVPRKTRGIPMPLPSRADKHIGNSDLQSLTRTTTAFDEH